MFHQNDVEISPMAEWGCYFCSILRLDEDLTGQTWTAREVLKLWSKNCAEGDIDYEATVLDPQGLCDDLKAGLKFLGKFGPDYLPRPCEREILLLEHPVSKYKHFVVGNGKGALAWDPYPGSKTAREGRVIGKRIYKIKCE